MKSLANWGTKVGIYKTGVDVLGTAWNPVMLIQNLAAGETGLVIKAGARQARAIIADAGSYGLLFGSTRQGLVLRSSWTRRTAAGRLLWRSRLVLVRQLPPSTRFWGLGFS